MFLISPKPQRSGADYPLRTPHVSKTVSRSGAAVSAGRIMASQSTTIRHFTAAWSFSPVLGEKLHFKYSSLTDFWGGLGWGLNLTSPTQPAAKPCSSYLQNQSPPAQLSHAGHRTLRTHPHSGSAPDVQQQARRRSSGTNFMSLHATFSQQ